MSEGESGGGPGKGPPGDGGAPGGGGGAPGGGGAGRGRRRGGRGRGGGGGGRGEGAERAPSAEGERKPAGGPHAAPRGDRPPRTDQPRTDQPRADQRRADQPRAEGPRAPRPPQPEGGGKRPDNRPPQQARGGGEARRGGGGGGGGGPRSNEPARGERPRERDQSRDQGRDQSRNRERGSRDAAPSSRPAPQRPAATPPIPDEESWDTPAAAAVDPEPPEVEAAPPPPRPPAPPPRPRDPDGEDVFLPDSPAAEPRADRPVYNVVALRFRPGGSLNTFDAGDLNLVKGDRVVVDSDRGQLLAEVALHARRLPVSEAPKRVLRRASADDLAAADRLASKQVDLLASAKRVARDRRLPLKVVRVESPLSSQGKTLVFFACEERIDFRELARDLQTALGSRVELKQLGARDEAKVIGGIGSCGRELCCSTFLPSFVPISIKAAKDQGLALTPTKVSGQCGRLKCCLVYEHDLYKELRRDLPKQGKRVETPAGPGRVVEVDVLKQRVRVVFEEGGSEYFPGNVVKSMFPSQQQGRAAEAEDPVDDEAPAE